MEGNETEHRPANVCLVAQVFTSAEERKSSFEFILMNCSLFSGREACSGISDSYFKSRFHSYAN